MIPGETPIPERFARRVRFQEMLDFKSRNFRDVNGQLSQSNTVHTV